MDLRLLEYYMTVYECGSFTKAARKLFITQQGLSKAIKKLEHTFGKPLFVRTSSRLVPTEFGEIFYKKVSPLFEHYQQVMKELYDLSTQSSILRIGFADNILSALKAEMLLIRFQELYPNARLSSVNMTDYECENALLHQKIDAAFSMGPFSSSDIQKIKLLSEPVCALLYSDHPLASRPFLTMEDLKDQPLIVADSRNKGYARTLDFFQKHGETPDIRFQTSDPLSHIRMVSEKLGISLLPERFYTLCAQTPGLKLLPITDLPKRSIYLIINDNSKNCVLLKQFISFTADFFKEY